MTLFHTNLEKEVRALNKESEVLARNQQNWENYRKTKRDLDID